MIVPPKFKARLFELPKVKDEKGDLKILGDFTVGKIYRVYAIYDSGQGFTDFLVADKKKEFHWINMRVFRTI